MQTEKTRRRPAQFVIKVSKFCNLRCKYCYIPLKQTEELSTEEILRILDELKAAGTQYLNFTGGEVLLREDIDAILTRTAALEFSHSINSNGTYVPEKIGLFRKGATLTLSLDGDESSHDAARGRGTHRSRSGLCATEAL